MQEFIRWQAYYKVLNEVRTNTLPPQEFSSTQEHAAALRNMLKG